MYTHNTQGWYFDRSQLNALQNPHCRLMFTPQDHTTSRDPGTMQCLRNVEHAVNWRNYTRCPVNGTCDENWHVLSQDYAYIRTLQLRMFSTVVVSGATIVSGSSHSITQWSKKDVYWLLKITMGTAGMLVEPIRLLRLITTMPTSREWYQWHHSQKNAVSWRVLLQTMSGQTRN